MARTATAAAVDYALRRLNIPIVGVAIGQVDDKATWIVEFAAEATPVQRTLAATTLAAFSADDPTLPDESDFGADLPIVRAIVLWYLRDKLGRNPTAPERTAARAALRQAYKDANPSA